MARMAISGAAGTTVRIGGREVVSFGGCNYLGLSYHPEVLAALQRGLSHYGISTSASRETTGNTVAHDALESAVRDFLGVESAVVVPDGYTANLAAAQALAGTHRYAVIDARCHRSIRESLACAGMTVAEYAHLDAEQAAERVREFAALGLVSVWTDGVFAADGSVAPVAELAAACDEHGAALIVDDCHGLFTMGPGGRGTAAQAGLRDHPSITITSTLAKGVGCHGGFVAGSNMIADMVRDRSTAYICTTPVSPAIACAAVEAFGVVQRELELVDRLRRNADELSRGLIRAGLRIENHGTPVFAFTTEGDMRALHESLLEHGFLAPLIEYPDGPAPRYFRLSVSTLHTRDQIAGLCAALARSLRAVGPKGALAGQ